MNEVRHVNKAKQNKCFGEEAGLQMELACDRYQKIEIAIVPKFLNVLVFIVLAVFLIDNIVHTFKLTLVI